MLALVVICLSSLCVGAILGWKFTAKHERLYGYAEAVDDQFKRLGDISKRRSRSNLRALEGGKK
jgi:hypothetical protein